MKKTITLFFSLLLGVSSLMKAQTPSFQWADGIGDSNNDLSKAVALDASGNVFHTGIFNGSVDFDPGAGSFSLTSVTGGAGGGYVSKLDPSGNFIWAVAIPGPAEAVATDASGNVYVTGTFTNTQDFDPGAGVLNFTTTSSNYSDAYIVKFSNSGNFIWAAQLGGTDAESPESIATDASGNIVLCGSFKNTVDFDPGAGTYTLASAGTGDGFAMKLNSAGNFMWAAKFGSIYSGESAYDIVTDATGNVFVSGAFAGSVDFDPSAASYSVTSTGGTDAYVVKLDAAGNYGWVKSYGGFANDDGSALALDASGNIYLGGTFAGTVDFDPSSTASYTVASAGTSLDSYVLKLDATGNFIFVKAIGSSGLDKCKDLQVAPSGNIFYVGYYSNTVDFDPSSTGTYTMTAAGSQDSFASMLDGSGNFMWAGGLSPWQYDYMEGVAISAAGEVYISGSFLLTTDFNMGSGTFNLTGNGGNDIFVTKLNTGAAGIKENGSPFVTASVYPNPSKGNFSFMISNELNNNAELTISDVTGKEILKQQVNHTKQIDLNISTPGLYFVTLESEGTRTVKKIVIQ